MRRINTIHFVGIGGSGMGGIAEVLLNLGYCVQGSDLKPNPITRRLAELGARVIEGHSAENIRGADVVVVSSAIPPDNPEVAAALAARIPAVQRAEMLGELMRFRYSIAVAGTHGKTTTTSLVASVLAEAGADPTFVIGGRLVSAGSNARLGTGRYLVAEADESDASFTHLQPLIAVVTNIDNDHLATHGGSLEHLEQSFVDFLHNLPFYGLAILCLDDERVRGLLPRVARPVMTYGLDAAADVRAINVRRRGLETHFEVVRTRAAQRVAAESDAVRSMSGDAPRAGAGQRASDIALAVTLALPGAHNVLNALAAIAVATELEIDDAAICRALAGFQGISRRLEHVADVVTPAGPVTIVDDYGHHPTEIAATLEALRQGYPGRRIVLAFQPHRFTRTRDLIDDFAKVLSGAEVLLVTEVYAAGEPLIPGADGRAICRAVRTRAQVEPIFVERVEDLPQALEGVIRADDLIVTMGAGHITTVAHQLPEALAHGRAP